jgi:HSP20 family protein
LLAWFGKPNKETTMPLIRRNTNDQALATRDIDPFRWPFHWMQNMLPWDPFQLPATVPSSSWFGPSFERGFAPAFDVKETKDSLQLKADLPGMKESDVEINLTGNRLSVTGKREAENEYQNDTYYTYERSYGSFQRTFTLPDGFDTDHIRAEMKDGVLTVALPKKATAQTKTVAIKTDEKARS